LIKKKGRYQNTSWRFCQFASDSLRQKPLGPWIFIYTIYQHLSI